jgi:transcriptional regulator with XRE-family HTH domain
MYFVSGMHTLSAKISTGNGLNLPSHSFWCMYTPMAQRPKRKDKDTSLKQLRKTLGIPQHELARILSMSHETIRSIEAGTFGLSKATREKVALYCGAAWDEECKRWIFPFTGEPYSREHYEAWKKPIFDREMEIHAICLQVLALLQSARKCDFKMVCDHLQSAIYKTKKTFRVKVTDKDFERAACRTGIPLNSAGLPATDNQPVAGYRWERPSLYREGDPHEDERGFRKYDPNHPEWYTTVKLFDFRDKLPKE